MHLVACAADVEAALERDRRIDHRHRRVHVDRRRALAELQAVRHVGGRTQGQIRRREVRRRRPRRQDGRTRRAVRHVGAVLDFKAGLGRRRIGRPDEDRLLALHRRRVPSRTLHAHRAREDLQSGGGHAVVSRVARVRRRRAVRRDGREGQIRRRHARRVEGEHPGGLDERERARARLDEAAAEGVKAARERQVARRIDNDALLRRAAVHGRLRRERPRPRARIGERVRRKDRPRRRAEVRVLDVEHTARLPPRPPERRVRRAEHHTPRPRLPHRRADARDGLLEGDDAARRDVDDKLRAHERDGRLEGRGDVLADRQARCQRLRLGEGRRLRNGHLRRAALRHRADDRRHAAFGALRKRIAAPGRPRLRLDAREFVRRQLRLQRDDVVIADFGRHVHKHKGVRGDREPLAELPHSPAEDERAGVDRRPRVYGGV